MIANSYVALVSPRDCCSGLLSENKESLTLISPASMAGRVVAVTNYLSRFPSTIAVEARDSDEVINHLNEYKENSLALDFTMLLFDQDISQSTRNDLASELDAILSNNKRREYVLDIILASPLTSEFDPELAKIAAREKNNVQSLIDTILESQARVCKAYSAWLEMRSDLAVKQSGIKNVYEVLIHFGVFRRLVEEGKTQADKRHLNSSITLDQELTNCCDPRILRDFIAVYSDMLPLGPSMNCQSSSFSEPSIILEPEEAYSHENTSKYLHDNAEIKLARVESQVDKVADLFGHGRDQPAKKYSMSLCKNKQAIITIIPMLLNRCATLRQNVWSVVGMTLA